MWPKGIPWAIRGLEQGCSGVISGASEAAFFIMSLRNELLIFDFRELGAAFLRGTFIGVKCVTERA